MVMIKKPLPNYCHPNRKINVSGALVHFISAKRDHPNDPFNVDYITQIFKDYKSSCNILIDRDGNDYELVPVGFESWHAGRSTMNGRNRCNKFCISIELIGGVGYDYTRPQLDKLYKVLAQYMLEYEFTLDWIGGHDQVRKNWNEKYPLKKATIKKDPGKHFPWSELNEKLQSLSDEVMTNHG